MSSASSGPAAALGDEFPVLLRLPDLNATATAPSQPAAPPEPVPSSLTAAQLRLDALQSTTDIIAGSLPTTSLPVPEPAPRTITSKLVAPAVTPVQQQKAIEPIGASPVEPVSLPTPRSQRLAAASPTNFLQWSMVKQLATGGVLVGGLALTYLLIMGGGDSGPPPAHIPVSQQEFEPPTIEVPEPPQLAVTPLHADPVQNDVASLTGGFPGSDANSENKPSWNNSSAFDDIPPTNMVSAEGSPRQPPSIGTPPSEPRTALRPEDNHGASATPPSQGVRIGPNTAYSDTAAAYPTTDPSNFLYRPTNVAPGEGPRTARLEGTISPPPNRK